MRDPLGALDGRDLATTEDFPDGRIIVEGDEPFAFESVETVPEDLDVGDGPGGIHAGVARGVWRVQEEEGFLPIVEIEAALPVEVFDGNPVESEVELPDGLHP